MKKDAFYFPHDSNASSDPKCVLLIEQLGLEGYGAYWILVEYLRDQPGYKCSTALLPALARRYNITTEKLKTVVCSYGLFVVENDEIFFSQSLINRMIPLEKWREKSRVAGLKSAEIRALKKADSTMVQPMLNHGSTVVQPVKYSKVNNSNTCANAHTAIADYADSFEKFWDLYDKKRNREKCMKMWKGLSNKDREDIMTYIPNYKLSQPDKQFRKDPLTFLNQKAWNDELIFNEENQNEDTTYKI